MNEWMNEWMDEWMNESLLGLVEPPPLAEKRVHKSGRVVHFLICACHPCAGAMLIFSAPDQVSPPTFSHFRQVANKICWPRQSGGSWNQFLTKKGTGEADNTSRTLLFRDLYTVYRDRPDRRNELMRVIEIIHTYRISSNLPLNVVFLCWLRFYFDARRFLKENRGSVLDFLPKFF